MTQWPSGDVIANGIRLHYYRTGGEKPPLVLLHGFSDNALCWTRVARALEPEYDVIMYDARGHGLSEAPESGYSSQDRAADLAGLVAALDIQRPALLGHSMGARTAAVAAALYPDLFSCVILEDPPWRKELESPEEVAARAEQRRAEILANKAKSRDELIALIRQRQPNWAEEELGPWADAKRQMSVYNATAPRESIPWQEVVRRIPCPGLLLTADPERGGIVTPEVAQEAMALWRQGRWVRIEGAGHSIHRDRFEPFIDAVKSFLGALRRGRVWQ